jgi:hypothetical protein
MARTLLAAKLENCIQYLAGEVLREVEGLTEDEKNLHYLRRSIENLVRLYAEGARSSQKRLAHERMNHYLRRIQRAQSSGDILLDKRAVGSLAKVKDLSSGFHMLPDSCAIARTERRFHRPGR